MKKKFFAGIVALVIIAAATFSIGLGSTKGVSDIVLSKVEALADDEYNGGELPEVVISCDTGGSGKCYELWVEEGLFGACRFYCQFTGVTYSNCNQWCVLFFNFCSAFTISCGGL